MQKTYLYHGVPNDLQGPTLFPLNTLKNKYPELYNKKVKKYVGREVVMQQIIPTLKCLWNDVLHFSAIPPKDLKNALLESGIQVGEMKFYELDPELLDPENTTIYLYESVSRETKMNLENFAEYNPNDLHKYTMIPQVTKDYYKEKILAGEQPLLYVKIPHILYRGEIDVSNIPIITV